VSVRRILAPNPGIYTGPGTNSYLIVSGTEALVLDPGPIIQTHRLEIVAGLRGLTPVGVVATHTHPDHAPLANPLARELGIPVFGHSPGPGFEPDIRLRDGDTTTVGSLDLVAVHTPGHTDDHLCFRLGERLFTGDHIMEGSTVVIEDATSYLDSLYKVRDLAVTSIDPGHGERIDDAMAAIDEYIDHRRMREAQIIEVMAAGAKTVGEVVDAVYAGVPVSLRPAATHQVIVQLTKLSRDGSVRFSSGEAGSSTTVQLNERS
jgi:glyoxylase-like metal-dependent hydrolase (beta-lactamase superfamily II)